MVGWWLIVWLVLAQCILLFFVAHIISCSFDVQEWTPGLQAVHVGARTRTNYSIHRTDRLLADLEFSEVMERSFS